MKETTLYLIGGFIGGAIAGATACYFAVKEKFKKQEDKKMEEIEDYYKHNSQYLRTSGEESSTKDIKKEEPQMNSDEKKAFRKTAKEPKQYIHYDRMYKGYDDMEKEEQVDKVNEDYEKNKDRPPRIISVEAAAELPGYYDNQTLIYYPESDVLVEEESDMVIDYPEPLVGDCLTKYDFKHSNEDMIYVVNYSIGCLYEIQKMEGEYEPIETHIDRY